MRAPKPDLTRAAVIATSIASLLPLVILWRHFQLLFFFHDDWLMLNGLDRLGLGRWLFEPFAGEGVFPLFKILWWSALHLTGGSYCGMIVILWITHAAICLLFGWLLAHGTFYFRAGKPRACGCVRGLPARGRLMLLPWNYRRCGAGRVRAHRQRRKSSRRPQPSVPGAHSLTDLVIFGLIKIAVFVWAFRKASPPTRSLLWTLVALGLLFAPSLGYARWPLGLSTATSSRYQYIPLLSFGPMVGILLARLRPGAQIAIALLCIVVLTLPWRRHIELWSTARGKTIRTAVAQDDPEQSFDPSSITAGKARELVRRYGLH